MHPSLTCSHKVGFLFSHPCGRPAAGQCQQCGGQFCNAHLRSMPEGVFCSECAGEAGERAGGWRDSSFYAYDYYPGYGRYDRGWGSGYYHRRHHHHHDDHDSDDFSEADGMSTRAEGDEAWESDMGAS